jgi:hypothetical protein
MRVARFYIAIVAILILVPSCLLNASTPAFIPPVPVAETDDGKRIMEKLNSIIIDKCNFDVLDLTKILPYLTKRRKELDPEHVGVRFILRGPYQPPPWNGIHREISLSLTDVPLIDVVRYLCRDTDHDFKIENNAVIVFPDTTQSSAN